MASTKAQQTFDIKGPFSAELLALAKIELVLLHHKVGRHRRIPLDEWGESNQKTHKTIGFPTRKRGRIVLASCFMISWIVPEICKNVKKILDYFDFCFLG